MGYALTILFLAIGTVYAETCTVSGKIVTCSDGSRVVQQRAVTTVTPGEGNMAELGVTYNDRYAGAGAGLRAVADMYGANRAANTALRTIQSSDMNADLDRRQNQDQFTRVHTDINVPQSQALIQKYQTEAKQAEREAAAREAEAAGLQKYRQDTLQWERDKHGILSAADKALDARERERLAQQARQAELGGYDDQTVRYVDGLSRLTAQLDSVPQDLSPADPRYKQQVMSFARSFNDVPGAAERVFGDKNIKGVSLASDATGRLIPIGIGADGKRFSFDSTGAVVPFDENNLGAYPSFSAAELSGFAKERAKIAQATLSPEARARYTKADADQIKASTAAIENTAERVTAEPKVAQAASGVRANAQEGIRQAMNSTFDSLLMGNTALRAAKPGRIENALGATSATGLTRKDYKEYELATGKGKDGAPVTAGDIIKHNLDAQMPKILGDATAVNYLRQAGIPIPDGPLETWTPDQQKAVGQQLTQALVGLIAAPAEQGGGLAALQDGIQERDLPGLRAALAQPPGAVNPNRYRDEGTGWFFNRAEQF